MDLKRSNFCDFETPCKGTYQKGKIESNEQSKEGEASRNKFMEKDELPDRVKSFREVDSSKNCLRAQLGFVKLIQNGLREEQNLIQSGMSEAETSLVGKENAIRLQKEE